MGFQQDFLSEQILHLLLGPAAGPDGAMAQLHILAPAQMGPMPQLHFLASAKMGPRPRPQQRPHGRNLGQAQSRTMPRR